MRAIPTIGTMIWIAIAASTPAWSHSWYPRLCCNEHDCGRIISYEPLPDGAILAHTAALSVIVPKGFPEQPSHDNHMHVCVHRSQQSGKLGPTCFFVPRLT